MTHFIFQTIIFFTETVNWSDVFLFGGIATAHTVLFILLRKIEKKQKEYENQ